MGRYCASTSREGAGDIPKTGHNDQPPPPSAGGAAGAFLRPAWRQQRQRRASHGRVQGTPAVYDLFAVANYYGRMGFRHYTAYERRWNERSMDGVMRSPFDDPTVRDVGDGSGG
mmetsp:Transcript_38519/g.71169  ORF Transcript_38519/g.71169 Transcript_38519/m.71169 type:complete len:114 (-) Transcript_38519:5-346(-)